MKISTELLDSLTAAACGASRLRMNLDLRTSPEDNSQRMLNALEPGTVLPVHRHRATTETVVVLRGRVRQNYYELEPSLENPAVMVPFLTESFEAGPGCEVTGFSVPAGRWHNTESLECGTVIFEAKDGRYEPLSDEDML